MTDSSVQSWPFVELHVARAIGHLGTYLISASAASSLVLNVMLNDAFHTARLTLVLFILILLHLMRFYKLLFVREFVLYAAFFCYMLMQLFWTDNLDVARNTIVPALNFVLILVLFGSLMTYHNTRTVLAGMFSGFAFCAAMYTIVSGFPFAYPVPFSYNAVALMYLFGLFLTLILACYSKSRWLLLIVGLVMMTHIVATTSIKTNLGILIGSAVAGLIYFREFRHLVRRYAAPLLVLLGLLGTLVASNESLTGSLERGASRVNLGIEVLRARDDVAGYGSFQSRAAWQKVGLEGWSRNPIFGNGVESFRSQFGITSHSTPIDLLHNSGLIGTILFYSIFASLAWRLLARSSLVAGNIRLLLLATLICFLSITLSGTLHYNAFLAATLAIGVAVVRRGHVDANENAMHTGKSGI